MCKQNSVHNFHSSLKSSQTTDLVLDGKSKAVTDFRRHADEEMKLSTLFNSFRIYADLPSTVHDGRKIGKIIDVLTSVRLQRSKFGNG